MNTTLRLLASAALAVALSSCGGGSDTPGPVATGQGTASGEIFGLTFTPKDAASGNGVASFSSNGTSLGSADIAYLVLRNAAGLCSDLGGRVDHPGEISLSLDLFRFTQSGGSPIVVGTYPISASNPPPYGLSATANFRTNDPQCQADSTSSGDATDGSVTLTVVNSVGYQGSYDLTFYNGDHLTGSFATGACSGYSPPPSGIHSCK